MQIELTRTEADVLRAITQPVITTSKVVFEEFTFQPKTFYEVIDAIYVDELIDILGMYKVWMNKYGIKSILTSLEKEIAQLDMDKVYSVYNNKIKEM